MDRGIQLVGCCPTGAPGRPETRPQARRLCTYRRPRGDGIARRHGVDPAVVWIMWAVQRGQIQIPFSSHHDRANLEGGLSDPLSEEQMLELPIDSSPGVSLENRAVVGRSLGNGR